MTEVSFELKKKTVANIAYTISTRGIVLLFMLGANIFLSRNLSSIDYGIVGFGLVFINFLNQFNDIGISSAVVQRKRLDERGLFTAFTIKALINLVLFIITFTLAPLTIYFFKNSEIVNVLRLLAFNYLINIFVFLPNSLLTRDLNYKVISIVTIFSSIINSLLAIIFVLNGFRYWSLVFANLIGPLAFALGLNVFKPVKMRILFDKEIGKEFMNYGWKLCASGIVMFFVFNADNLIVGWVNGSSNLGYYMIGFTWGSMVCGLMSETVLIVLFPTFSKIREEIKMLKASYLKTIEYVSIISILINITLFITAQEFLILVLGRSSDKWLPALNVLRIICIYGIIRSLLEPIGSVIMAVGKTGMLLKSNLLAAILNMLFIYPALKYIGIEGAAIVVTIAYLSQYFVYWPFLKKELGISIGEIMKVVYPSVCAVSATVITYYVYDYYLEVNRTWITFIQKMVISSIGYFLFYGIVTNWKVLGELKSIKNVKTT